jgi:hypothetical protein
LSGGDHRWFKRSTRKKRPVTRDDDNNNNNNNNNNNIVAEEIYIKKYNVVYAQIHFYLREEIGLKLEKES